MFLLHLECSVIYILCKISCFNATTYFCQIEDMYDVICNFFFFFPYNRRNKTLLKEWWLHGFTCMVNGLRYGICAFVQKKKKNLLNLQITYKMQESYKMLKPLILLSLWCRNAIMLKYIKRSQMKTWSWCVNVSLRLWYGRRMTQTQRRLADNLQLHIYFDFSFFPLKIPSLGIF